jgi:hypothetical protein
MNKPVSTVQLGIARLGLICSDIPDNAQLGLWLRKFHRALTLKDITLDEYASELLREVEEYRENERNRKVSAKIPTYSNGFQRKDAASATKLASQLAKQQRKQPPTPFQGEVWFSNPLFAAAWKEWEQARKVKGGDRQLKTLKTLSGENLESATQILLQSADNQWRGLFPLKGSIPNFKPKPELSGKMSSKSSAEYLQWLDQQGKIAQEERKNGFTFNPPGIVK